MTISNIGLSDNVDIIKVFATRRVISFRWLELPSLNGKGSRMAETSLEELYEVLTEMRLARNVMAGISEWETAEVMIRTVEVSGIME